MTQPVGAADLHIHTSFSDGVLTPAAVLARAAERGLTTVAFADHDTVRGISAAPESHPVQVVPAVELSTSYDNVDVHILGYGIDHRSDELNRQLVRIQEARVQRAHEMVHRLGTQGVDLDMQHIFAICKGDSVGRPHLAQALMERGYVSSFGEAFYRFIGYHCPAYVPKLTLEPAGALDLIRRFGGVPVLAHPGTYRRDDIVTHLVKLGVMGIEVWHPEHSSAAAQRYLKLCREAGLVATGGSDYHGGHGRADIGAARTPAEWLRALRDRVSH